MMVAADIRTGSSTNNGAGPLDVAALKKRTAERLRDTISGMDQYFRIWFPLQVRGKTCGVKDRAIFSEIEEMVRTKLCLRVSGAFSLFIEKCDPQRSHDSSNESPAVLPTHDLETSIASLHILDRNIRILNEYIQRSFRETEELRKELILSKNYEPRSYDEYISWYYSDKLLELLREAVMPSMHTISKDVQEELEKIIVS